LPGLEGARESESGVIRVDLFRGARLVRFEGVDGCFEGADFAGADLKESNFFNAKLGKAAFRGELMQGAAFATANLDEADLEDADLTGASLAGATLRGATLTNAVLAKARLSTRERGPAHRFGGRREVDGAPASGRQVGARRLHEARVLAGAALERLAHIHGKRRRTQKQTGSNLAERA